MVIPDERNPALIKPTNVKVIGSEMGSRKFGVEIRHNRGPLSVINQNLVVAEPYPCVVNKRLLSNQKSAAQLVNTQEEACQETKKARPPVVDNFTIWEDCTIKDVNEQETGADQHMAMILEQTEEFINGKEDQMEEVEMEDIFEEPVLNIDSCDARNPLAVVEYVDDLYAYYRKMESSTCASPNYMEQQFDINEKMRSILIDWLIEVHHKFDLNEETLFLTVNIIDRFLSNQGVVRKKLQLVGLVAMLLACKYEEVSVPIVDDLIFISDKAYTRTEVLEMERLILMTLQFNMSVPTPYVFMKRFLKAAQSDRKIELLSFYLIELCLVEYEMLKFPPSFLAAAVVYTAQCSLYGIKQWTKTFEWHTNYYEDQLLECSKMIVSFHQKASTGRLTGVHRKYSTYKFGYVSKTEPAHFLMVETQQQ